MGRNFRSGVRRHLTYANVMSTLAVFLLLAGGTALAAGLRKNSVNSKTVKNNSLQSADLKDGNGVTDADVADGSLNAADVADGSLKGADVADRSVRGADVADGSIGGADIASGKNGVGLANIGANAVDSSNVLTNSLRGADFGTDILTGRRANARGEIDESTLDRVPNAEAVSGLTPGGLLSGFTYEKESPNETGLNLGDGTFTITQACKAGDLVLSGGPINTESSTTLVESHRNSAESWIVRVRPPASGDAFNVAVICADQ